ncbi:MAG: hypothetical protein WBC73_00665 [Phormidesmis sp.]
MDENVDPAYLNAIRKRNRDIVVRAIGDPAVPGKSTLDPDILKWCEEKQFALITNNRKSMPSHLSDHLVEECHIPGIITLSKTMSVGDMIDELIFLAEASNSDEFQDQIRHMPIL